MTSHSDCIQSRILTIRGVQVMLDRDLAELYGVSTSRLNEQVTRNRERFPERFMRQLTKEEFMNLKSQFATSSWGGVRKPPRAFTEQGISMLSSVLRSATARLELLVFRTTSSSGVGGEGGGCTRGA